MKARLKAEKKAAKKAKKAARKAAKLAAVEPKKTKKTKVNPNPSYLILTRNLRKNPKLK